MLLRGSADTRQECNHHGGVATTNARSTQSMTVFFNEYDNGTYYVFERTSISLDNDGNF